MEPTATIEATARERTEDAKADARSGPGMAALAVALGPLTAIAGAIVMSSGDGAFGTGMSLFVIGMGSATLGHRALLRR